MTLGDFLSTWRGTTLENRVWRITVLVLVASNLILVGLVGQVERTVVLVPPVLEGEVTIAREYASQQVEESWGVYVAQLLGNVGPTTVDGLVRVLDPLLGVVGARGDPRPERQRGHEGEHQDRSAHRSSMGRRAPAMLADAAPVRTSPRTEWGLTPDGPRTEWGLTPDGPRPVR